MNEINIKLPNPHAKQREILNAYFNTDVRNITVSAGRRGGKSTVIFALAIIEAFNSKIVSYICPTAKHARFFFKEILKWLPPSLIKINKTYLEIEFEKGGQIKFYGADGDSLDGNIRGTSADLIIIDESAFIAGLKDKVDGVLSACLSDRNGRMVMISTPYGKNDFFEYCQLNDGKFFSHFHYTSYDNPYIKREVIERFRKTISTAHFNQEYLAIPGENANAFVDMEVITRNTITTLSSNPTVIYGVDVACTPNGDYTSVTGLDSFGVMTYHKHIKGYNTNIVYDMLAPLEDDILKVIDRSGMGQGIFDRLQSNKQNWMGIQFNIQTKKELVEALRASLYQDKLKFNEVTSKELSTYIATLNSKTGHVSYNSISNCNDDTVISLGIANQYLDLAKTANPVEFANRFMW